MLLRLQAGLQDPQLESILALCKDLGLTTSFLEGRRDLVQVDGPADPRILVRLEGHPLVRNVIDRGDVRWQVDADPDRAETVVTAGHARFGGGWVSIAAGPCAVEDEARMTAIARDVKERGATLLRGGAYKPRTSPYAFQGLGEVGLEILARVKADVGIGIVTEVMDTRDVDKVAAVADMVQVGARNMANYPLLRELAKCGRPVMLKRGFGATVKEFLGAAEYLLEGGNPNVVLCERGVRGFDSVTRDMLDVGAIAHLETATHLPVIGDPSHAAGRADLVPNLARAALAAGADGLMVEVHDAPEEARSDAGQALSMARFGALVERSRALAELLGKRVAVCPSSSEDNADRIGMEFA
tara:strand:- start:19976 stop:21043 length:1068 start_codon:yes stop_codon:yes gene_type:complete